jgi:hypothetical protein
VCLGIVRVQNYWLALLTCFMLFGETLASMIWVMTQSKESNKFGAETTTIGWGMVGFSALWCLQIENLRRKHSDAVKTGTIKDLSQNDWRDWHAEILSVFTSAAQVFFLLFVFVAMAVFK